MTHAINPATFEATEAPETHSFGIITKGTVEVTLGRETRRLPARRMVTTYDEARGEATITAYGLGGRYHTGSKVWPASITIYTDGPRAGWETANFGRDDRDPKFNKLRGIFFTNP